jgi:hypothetical protein
MPPRKKPETPGPNQGELFETPTDPTVQGRTDDELAKFARLVGEAAATGSLYQPDSDATDSHKAALEDGSGASPFVARLVTGQEKPPFTGTQEPPRPPRPPKKPRYSRRGGRSYPEGPSGIEVGKEIARQSPGSGLSPQEQARVNREGINLVRAALAAAREDAALTSYTERHTWSAPEKVVKGMRTLISDNRARFRPTTTGETTLATNLLEYLNPTTDGLNGVSSYLSKLHDTAKRGHGNQELSEVEKQASANKRVQSELERWGNYAHDAASKLVDLMALSDILDTRQQEPTLTLAELLKQGGGDATKGRGLLSVVQHTILRELTIYGRSSTGVDPLRNLGINFDEIAAGLGSDNKPGRTKMGEVLEYVQEKLGTMTVLEARKLMLSIRKEQWNRAAFWSTVLRSAGDKHQGSAQAILDKVWRTK